MKLATTTGDFLKYASSPAEAVKLYEGTGFRHLDYNFYSVIYAGSPFLGDSWMDEVKEAGRAAEKLGFDFVQAHAPSVNCLKPDADMETGLLATVRSIEASAYLGVKNLVVHSGIGRQCPYPQGREVYFQKNRAFFEALLPHAERCGVNLLIENSGFPNMGGQYFFVTGQEMNDFIDYVGHPNLKACWDIGHANMDERNQYEELKTLGANLAAVHIQDNYGGFDEHAAPMQGTCDMDAVIQGLLDSHYKGYFTFEADNILLHEGTRWPHPRRSTTLPRPARLRSPSAALKRQSIALLYEIGRWMLERYDCFEE